jgi:phage-related minor tail protein
MAQSVAQSAQQASKAVSGMGDGAASAAQKIGAAQGSIVDAVRKSTDTLTLQQQRFISGIEKQATIASQGKAAYLELRASQLGVGDAAAAAIAKIRAAEQGTASLGNAAAKTAYQLRQVAPQVTDIVTQLAAGQAPIQILIQQGGQLKDVFGGVGPAVKALGGYLATLITPTSVLAAGVGVLALAYIQGAKEARAFTTAAILSGSDLGKSLSNYTDLRDAITGIGATKGKAAEVLTEIAAKGELAGTAIKDIAQAAILMEKATGQATEKTVAQFVALAKSPTDAIAKLNDQYNFLTSATYKQIKALEDQGKKQEAANLAEQTYAEALKTRAQSVVDSAGTMEKAWNKVAGGAKAAWDAMLGVGRQLSVAEQLGQVQAKIARAQGPFDPTPGSGNAELRAQLPLLQEQAKALQRKLEIEQGYAVVSAQNTQLEKDKIDYLKEGDQYLTKRQQMEKEIARERERDRPLIQQGLLTEEDLTKRIAAIREKYVETTGESEVAQLKARLETLKKFNAELGKQIESGIFPADGQQPTQAEQKALALQHELAGSILGKARAEKEAALAVAEETVAEEKRSAVLKATATAVKEAQAALLAQVSAVTGQADAIRQQAAEQEAANAVFGKGRVAVEEYRLAQTKATYAELEATETADPRYVAGLKDKVEAQKRYVEALTEAANKQLAYNNLQLTQANQRDASLIAYELSVVGQVADVRALLIERRRIELDYAQKIADVDKGEGSESAKAEARRVIEQQREVALSNATTRAVVDQWQRASDEISNSLTDAFTQAFENGGNIGKNLAQALKREFANLVLRPTIQAALSASGIPQLLGQQAGSLTGAASGLFGLPSIGSLFGGSQTGSATGVIAGDFVPDVEARALGSAGSAGFMGSIGSALPYVGAALLAAQAFGLFDHGGPKTESGAGSGVPLRGDAAAAQAIVDAITAGYKQAADAIGAKNTLDNLGAFIGTDPQGTAQTQLQVIAGNFNRGTLTGGGALGENVGRDPAALAQAEALAITQAIVKGLQDNAGSGPLADFIKSFDITSASLDTLQHALQVVTDVGTLDTALGSLGDTFSSLKGLSIDNKEALAQQFGGVQNLVAGLANFNDKFLTDAEKQALTQQQLSEAFAKAGVALPASIDAFREAALAAEQAVGTPDGDAKFKVFIDNASTFYDLAQQTGSAIGDAAGSLADALDKLANPIRTVQDIAQSIFNLQKESSSLQVQLLQAKGDTPGAQALQRTIDTAGLTDAEVAIYDYNQSLRAQIDALTSATQAEQAAAQQRYDLETQLLQLQGDTAALRERELATLDPTNRAIQEQIYALQDQQSAAEAAAQAAQDAANAQAELAAKAQAIAQERYGLETQLLQLQGDTAALRQRELDALDPTNRALLQQIFALEDAQAAEEKRTAALQKAKDAAQQIRDEWVQVAQSLTDEAKRIRGVMVAESTAGLTTQFAILTAQARALDKNAAASLPGAAEALLANAETTARSRADLMTVRGQVAQSLEITAGQLTALSAGQQTVEELRGLRADFKAANERQSKHEAKTAALEKRVADVLDEWKSNDFAVTT